MATTLVGIFDNYTQAQQAVNELVQMGARQGSISVARNEPAGKGYTTYGGANSKDYTTGTSIGDKIGDFFTNLFGSDVDENERGIYAESVRRGSVLVVVDADDAMADRAAEVLNRNGAVDVDRRTAQYRASGYQKFDSKAALYTNEQTSTEFQNYANQGEIALPVIEEQLNVGKRVVQRGAVRVHTRVIETPVQESVSLREEHVHVERHAVNRPASEADFASAQQTGEVVLTERNEVAVVGKEARVVEEVSIGKDVTERVETISDTVRRTDVQVEEIDSTTDLNRANTGKR